MSITVSLAQMNLIVGSFKQNVQMITDTIKTTQADNTDIITFSELVFGKDRRYPITLSLESDLVSY